MFQSVGPCVKLVDRLLVQVEKSVNWFIDTFRGSCQFWPFSLSKTLKPKHCHLMILEKVVVSGDLWSEFCYQEKKWKFNRWCLSSSSLCGLVWTRREGRGDTTIPQYDQNILEVAYFDIISQYSDFKGYSSIIEAIWCNAELVKVPCLGRKTSGFQTVQILKVCRTWCMVEPCHTKG